MPVKMIILDAVTVIEASDETLKVFIKKNTYITSACTVTGLSC